MATQQQFLDKIHDAINANFQRCADDNIALQFELNTAGLTIRATKAFAGSDKAYQHANTMGWADLKEMADPELQIGHMVDHVASEVTQRTKAGLP